MAEADPQKTFNVHEAKTQFSKLVDRAHAGEEIDVGFVVRRNTGDAHGRHTVRQQLHIGERVRTATRPSAGSEPFCSEMRYEFGCECGIVCDGAAG